MHHLQAPTAALLALAAGMAAPTAHATTYHVYLLAGQSNMVGYGTVSEMPAPVNTQGVRIYLGQTRDDHTEPTGLGLWAPLTPGFGTGATTDGGTNQLSDRFGPELTFAARLAELRPAEHIAIIKYAKGGTAIDARAGASAGNWDPFMNAEGTANPTINQHDHALATIREALKARDIDGDGAEDTLVPAGIVWMQGESDAARFDVAADYADNLARLAALFRAALRDGDLPFVVGRISDRGVRDGTARVWKFGDTIRDAQAAFAEADPRAALVTSTNGYGYSDPYHYDTAGYLDLGRAFAEAVHALREGPSAP